MTIINFDVPRTPCLTGFGNLTMYNWKMSPLLVKFLNQEGNTEKQNPFAEWNNHPQTKAETTHTLKGWIPKGGDSNYIGEIKVLQAATVKPWVKSTCSLQLLERGEEIPGTCQADHTVAELLTIRLARERITCIVDLGDGEM